MTTIPGDLRFSTVDEVAAFEQELQTYQTRAGAPAFEWLSLSAVWQRFQEHSEGGRIFAAILDLRLNVAALEVDLGRIRGLVNTEIRGENNDPGLGPRFELYQLNTGYVVRFRAVLDKIMALIVLTAESASYKSFLGSKSRKKSFRKVAGRSENIPDDLAGYLERLAQEVDERYRTAEVHGTGSIRKWSFAALTGSDSPQADMFWAWNHLHPLLTMLGGVLAGGTRA